MIGKAGFSLILFFNFISCFCFGQLTESDSQLLRIELSNQINELRKSKKVNPLIFNDTLKSAATFHSNYMVNNSILTHDEKNPQYSTPQKRVIAYGGKDFELIGENVLFSTPQKFPLSKKEIKALADEMFTTWKNSPGHYANMIDPEYINGDLGFAIDKNKGIIYATQVFGKKGVVVSNQLSKNAFGLSNGIGSCEKDYQGLSNVIANMGNSLTIVGNTIKFYHHDISDFQRIIKNAKDGFAVDLITKDQMKCGSTNQLDFSPIYDGVLLEPIYKNELLNANEAQSEYRIITKVGKIPQEFQYKETSFSLLIIKDDKVCKYLIPAYLPYKAYQLRGIEPIINNPSDVIMLHSGIIDSKELNYNFKTGISYPVNYPPIENNSQNISSITIHSYSSVEGDSSANKLLSEQRALAMKKHLKNKLGVHDSIFHITSQENWEMMKFQLHYFHLENLAELPKDSLKKLIVLRGYELNWDSLFFAQRKATATIHYYGEFNTEEENSKVTELNLRTAIQENNIELANKALFVMYEENNFNSSLLFEKSVTDFFKKQPKLVTNYTALLSKIYTENIEKSAEFIFNWINDEKKLDDDSRFNLTHLYTLVGIQLLDQWDLAAKRLANVIHPQKINVFSNKIAKAELILNLHLTYIQYYGQINDGANIKKSFNYITNYFKSNSLGPVDDVDLALFYNSWSMYHMTIDHLLPKFEKNSINEDGVFVLAQTMNYYNNEKDSETYYKVHQKASEINSQKWCDWINQDFQILRNHIIKRRYCEICN